MNSSPQAFYLREGPLFTPTEATIGPWSPNAQHGGPPSALIATSMESFSERENTCLTRIAIEILRPIPIGPIEISIKIDRPGRKVELLSAEMRVGSDLVMLARAWRMRIDANQRPAVGVVVPEPPREFLPGPITRTSVYFPYGESLDWHFQRGSFDSIGPATAWTRPRIPLILGETTSPLARLLLMADSANGISRVLSFESWTFVPVDMVVSLYRQPVTEWLGISAETIISNDGVGLTKCTLFDQLASIGASLHTLFVEPTAAAHLQA